MTGSERVLRALRGEWPDRTPVMLHNFMMAAREAGITMRQFRTDPDAIARAFIESVERYDYDAVVLDIDTVTLAGALGVPLDLPADLPARTAGAALGSLDAVAELPPPAIARDPRVQVWVEAVRLLRAHFGDEILVRGNCDQCPFSLAGLMRGLDEWMMDVVTPERAPAAHRLLEYCTGAVTQFLELVAGAGAHMLSNGDSPAGPDLVSPQIYRAFALPYEKEVVRCAHSLKLPYALHICGKTDRILDDMVETGADALDLDYKTSLARAREALNGRTTFIGNIDPSGVLALGTPSAIEAKTRELCAVFAGTPRFILNAGCAIPADTPRENLEAMIVASRN